MSALDRIINRAYDTPDPDERNEVEEADMELAYLRKVVDEADRVISQCCSNFFSFDAVYWLKKYGKGTK